MKWARTASEREASARVERDTREMDALEATLPAEGPIPLPPVVVRLEKYVAREAKRPGDAIVGWRAVWFETTDGAVLAVASTGASGASLDKLVAQTESWK